MDAVSGTLEAASRSPQLAPPPVSIFSLHSRSEKRKILLIAASISILTPFTDTIVLPALPAMRSLAGADDNSLAAIVSAYMAALGVMNLFWGPLSDLVGRRPPLFASLFLYTALSAACIFAPDMRALVLLRAFQGAVTGATISCTQGSIADAFAPSERGTAMGLFFVPLLVGPIVAPVLGGLVAAAMDWRAVFIFCVALAVPMLAAVLALPETQHSAVAARRAPGAAPILEPCARPAWRSPLQSLAYLVEPALAPFSALMAVLFALLFVSLTTLPLVMARAWLSVSEVGASFLPVGVCMLAGSVAGGVLSDRAGAAAPGVASARLLPSLWGALAAPAGALIFGWSASLVGDGGGGRGALAGVLVGHCLIGLAHAVFNPGFFAFISTVKQDAAAGVSGAVMAASFAAMGSLTKYLVRGKKALMKMLKAHPASRVGFFEHMTMGLAAMRALEMQHGECPRRGVIYAFALDGTITPLFTPEDEELKVLYWSLSKKISAVNSVFLVSPLGTIHAFRVAATGNTPDHRLAQPIFEWLFDPDVNPFKFGVITDYGMASQCSSDPRYPPISRPFAPTKDTPIADPALALQVAAFSRWLCTCRQFNEWVNGSAKRGFPRMLCKTYVHHVAQLRLDMELYLLLYNFRVRTCEWSQTRTVYLEHAQAVFDEQGLVWNEAEGVFLAKDRGDPPMEE